MRIGHPVISFFKQTDAVIGGSYSRIRRIPFQQVEECVLGISDTVPDRTDLGTMFIPQFPVILLLCRIQF